ncbi:MBOAT family O-acyltransferase [Novosphingobium album (ex Liu et al. 2023)]|uniref:Probable alginate O-acetylase AlgI n=1 Tax=Novosphingobium album (ex Liu et al. 2023) TaxID=3031130 RepID=A0ABT5WQA3_9SPHN|nr:MBOAT family O-acyltransferase [Novosphingobium album (ex Liu et al. 2023)]MDE8652204.1 hypothetical protein [Novosphingobium album (ex Liu et al. 2023)]
MLFNSATFIFVFLPFALLLFHAASKRRSETRQGLLVALTVIFYAWGAARYLPLLLLSIVINYGIARLIEKRIAANGKAGAVLVIGVCANLALLGLFKYLGFAMASLNEIFGLGWKALRVALPLAISFYTFQQIGFLMDLSRGRMTRIRLLDYFSFVLFFPQLLAGPIVRWDELVPQLHRRREASRIAGDIVIGLAYFSAGLFKKSVIADSLAGYAAPAFVMADSGHTPGLLDAWLATFTYTAQIYFDFSGYSDMAIGVARMLGIILPLNFHSPLRAGSVIELWRRWHVTLSRWAQSYVFQPLSIPLVRRAMTWGGGKTVMFILGFAVPTMLAMVTIGIWHGAGWTFVLFGVMQGTYMAINELWRQFRRKARKRRKETGQGGFRPVYQAITLTSFAVSVVMFRASDVAAAIHMYKAMSGQGAGGFISATAAAQWDFGVPGALVASLAAYCVILLAPNTQQWLGRFNPVLEWPKWKMVSPPMIALEFRFSWVWIAASAFLFFAAFNAMMRGTTNFIYFNF